MRVLEQFEAGEAAAPGGQAVRLRLLATPSRIRQRTARANASIRTMDDAQQGAAPAAAEPADYTYRKKKDTRWWEVRDSAGELACLTVYQRGAREVVRRLAA